MKKNKEMENKPYFVTSEGFTPDKRYKDWLGSLKKRLQVSQAKAAVSVNSSLLEFNWKLGLDIIKMDIERQWGSKFYNRLSLDMQDAFPGVKGFSVSNLKYIKRWVEFYLPFVKRGHQGGDEIGHQVGDDLEMPRRFAFVPWKHHVYIFTKSESIEEALFYINKTIEGNWSRSILEDNIDAHVYAHQGKAITNFDNQLPTAQGDLAKEILKDSYNFDFLTLKAGYDERQLEDALISNISRFLLELGRGFAFIGRQMELVMPGGQVFRPDLVFYHTKLKCYVVIDLKVVSFIPEFAGKINFYVNAADDLLKDENDNPSIGLLICKSKDDMVVKWSFQNINSPMGVATYKINKDVQEAYSKALPSEDDVKRALEVNVFMDYSENN